MDCLRLDLRLHQRAAILSVDDLVGRAKDILDNGNADSLSDNEEYIELNYALGSVWSSRMHFSHSYRAVMATSFAIEFFINSLVCLAVSQCLPAWILGSSLWCAVFILKDLFETAMSNEEVETIAGFYRSAAADIRFALLRAPPAETIGALGVRDGIRQHIDILESFAAERGNTARFFGFVVSFGSVRTLLVTSLTVLVALWSIMRGLGLRISIESACPNQLMKSWKFNVTDCCRISLSKCLFHGRDARRQEFRCLHFVEPALHGL